MLIEQKWFGWLTHNDICCHLSCVSLWPCKLTDHIECRSSSSCSSLMFGHTDDVSTATESQLPRVQLQTAALTEGAIRRLSVTRYTALTQRTGRPVCPAELPAQIQTVRSKTRRLTLNQQHLPRNQQRKRRRVDGQRRRLWKKTGSDYYSAFNCNSSTRWLQHHMHNNFKKHTIISPTISRSKATWASRWGR